MTAGVALDTGVLILKRALLSWINGVLHGQSTTNFNIDWKDGRRLSALVDYCKPGLIPDHASLKASNAAQNIRHAMELARTQLGIALFMAPDDLAAEKPDEYGLMMYISQFCGPDSPGQRTLLSWIQQQIPDQEVTGFTLSWVDGRTLGALTNSVSGGKFSKYSEMKVEEATENIEQSMIAAEKMLGIRRIITPDQFSKADLDQLLRLSYLSQFYNAKENKDTSSMAPAAAEKVEVSDIQIPNKLGEGKPVWVELECSDAGYGEVKAEVKGREAGSVQAVVKEVEEDDGMGTDKFHVSFVPHSVDVYDFSILYGGSHVTGSPFSVNLYPPDPEKVKHTGTEDSSETGQDVAMSFETKEAGRGKLNAKASGEITGTVPIRIIPLGDGSFTVSFNPPFPDIYTVDVLWGKFTAQAVGEHSGPVALQVNQDKKSEYLVSFKPPNPDVYIVDVNWDGKPVPGSPFTIDLLPPPQPEQVECAVPIYNEPGEEAELLVDATAAGSGTLTTHCTGEKTGELPVEIEKIAGRTYQVSFTPPEKDLYTLDVLFDDKHVKGSPFAIDMRPGAVQEYGEIQEEQPPVEAKPDASKCVLLNPPRAGMVLPIKKPLCFSVNCEEAGPGELKITADGPAVNPPDISVEPRPDERSVFDVTFVPNAPSVYAINLLWSGEPITKAPLKVSAVDPANVTHILYGKPVGIDFDADCKSNELKVHVIHDETGANYKAKITKVHKGKYKVSFQPKEPGHYRVHISVKDKEIPESPIIIFYDKPPKPEACKVSGLNSKCYVREPVNFTIDATEAGSGDLSIKHLAPKHKKEKAELTVNDNKDGTYTVDFVPHSIGDHSFTIGWAGKPIPGTPFHTAAVERKPDIITDVYLVENPGQSSQMEKEVPTSDKNPESLIGKPLLVRVTVSDELKEEKLTANAVGRTSGPKDLDISRKSDNVHEILLNPTESDLYTVTAKVGDKDIPRTPLDIEYTKPTTDPTKCKIIKVDKRPSTAYVNKPIDFKVYTENAGPGDLAVTADSPMVDEPLAVEVKQSPVKSVYNVSYAPKGPGTHTLNFTWAGEPIPESPIQMNVSEPPTYSHGQPVGMDINADCKPGDLEAHAEHVDSNTPYKVKIAKVHKGKYKLTLEPKDPGYYHVHVLMKQNEVPGSPFVIKYGEPSHPEKCVIRDQPDSVYVGRPITFTVAAHGAGSGELNIQASVPKTEGGIQKPDLRVGDNKDGTFSVECIPNTPGEHSFHVLWAGDAIPDSPVKVDVKKEDKDEEEEEKEEVDRGMDLTDLLDEYITSPKPIDEKMDATPADEVEAGIPLAPIKIERRKNPIIIVVGKALKLKVRPKDDVQREGTLVAKAQGEETGAGDVKTSQNEDGVFEVYFNPPKPDYYVVDVKLNGEEVPQSPFHVLYISAPVQEPAVHAPVNEQLFATFIPDKPIDYNIDLSQAGDGALSAKCVGESCGDVPVTYEPVSPDSKKYKVAFVPPQPDLYNLSVFFDDKELKDSPYKIDLRKKIEEPVDMLRLDDTVEALPLLEAAEPTEDDGSNTSLAEVEEDAHTIEEVPPEEFTIYIGTPLVVKVHPKTDDQKNSELTGTAVGDSVGPVKVSTFRQPDDTMIVKVNPTQPDRYMVDIKLNDEAIPRSPFRVNYIMPPTDPTQCKLIGVEDIPDYIEVGTEVDLQVDTKKAGPGDLMVSATPTVKEDNPSLLSAKKNDNETGMYDVTYIPNSQGKHSLNFKWADQSIPLSPVDILAIDPAKIEMVPYGKPAGVDVDSDSSLRAHCIHKESNQNYKVKTHKLQKGKYRLSFQPKDPGLYFLHAFVKDKELPQSPYIIRYARPAKPDACKVIGLGDRCFLGETVAFTVDTKEAGDGNLQIKTLGPDGKEKGTCDLKDNKDDTHSAEFAPEVAGMHELQITWAGKPVPGQPFPLFVRDHSKEELLAWLFLVDRLGELHPVDFPHKDQPEIAANTDQALLLRVQARTDEQKNGKLTVKATDLESGKKYDVEVTKTRGDTFEARFLPTVPQTYNIEALLDTKPIPNTPFAVKYNISQPDASKCVILGLEKHPDKFQVGKDIFFQVDTRLAGDGKLSLTADGVQVKPRLEAKASKEDTRIIDVTYTPAAPGTHMLKVLWSGETVPKSPLSFPVEAITRYPYGKPVGLDIDLVARAGDIDAHVIHKDTGARLKVKITKPSKGKYRFAFQPKKPGLYALHILVKKKEIKESPIYFRYEGPPRPEACIVRDVPEACYIREPTSFTVDATEAGSSNLVVKVASPSKGKEGELKILNNEDGTYTVDHTPEVLGEHKLNITWAGKTIPDSPVCINVKKRVPKAKTCLGPYVNIVPVGESVELDIINLGKYSGSDSYVTATARGKTGNDKPTVNDKDGTCKVTFMPTVTDDYIFNVKIHEEDVEGSPFYIKSVDKPSLSKDFEHPEGGCHSDVEVGKEVCLVIPRDELLPPGSEPQVEAIGPEGPCTVELIDEVESSYGLNFTPTIPGDYLVHVKKDKETEDEIDRSPFKVTATEKQSDALKVRVPESQQNIFADPIPLGTPVDFDINTADAGYGTLKVRQTGPGKADIKLTDKGRGVFGCNVLPTEKGQCTLDILWDDDGILGCPFNLMFVPIDEEEEEKEKDDRGMDLTDLLEEYIPKPIDEKMDATPADEVEAGIPLAPIKIERRQNPIIIVVGKALKLKVRPKDEVQREGTLVAKAQGEETGAGDVKTSQNEDGVFQVYFNPPKPDYYVVDVKLNGEDVPQSPFHVLYIPAPVQEPAVHAPVNEQLFATFIPDKPIDYNIDLSQAGDGALSAKCVGESCGDVPVTYAPVSPDSKKYKVAFVPPQPDLYNLSVFFDDKELKDSPYKIDLRKKIEEPVDMLRLDDTVEALPLLEAAEPTEEDGSNTSLTEVEEDAHTIEEVPPEEFTIYIGTPLVVKVHPKTDDQKNSELTGTAIGDSFGPVKVSTFRQPDDTMIVKVNPTQPDRYTVDIKLNDEAIPRSPFRVNYIMPPTDPTQCKLIGVEDIPDYIEVGTEVDLQVDTKKAGPGDLMVSATPTVEEENPSLLSAKKNDNETGMYDVTYIPNSQGKHSLNFKWADQSIPLSPVDILAIDPAKIEMVPYGKPAGVDVDSDSSLRAHCIHKESNQNYKVKTHKLQKGKYRLSFQPKDPGLYFLHAFVKDKELPQSPYIIRYARPAKPDACKVIGLGDRCFLGETVAFTVDTKEAGDGNLQIKTLGPDGKEKGMCDLKDNKDDTYSAEFAPEVAGMHELQITWAGKPVPGQPFPLFVRDHSKEELLAWLFLVDRLGELHPVDFPHKDQPEITANTDQALLLRVQARTDEQKNGKLAVKATDLDSGKKYDVEVTKTRGDTFEARFLPTVPQTYNIEALLDTKPIPNTPFAVKYNIAQPDASKCVILGLEKHPEKFQVGKDIFFQVDTRLAGDGKLSLTADGVQVKPRLEAKASKEDTRIIDVTYTPAAPGTHMLKVLWSGEPVPKSPLSFPVEAITRYPYGKPVGLDIDLDARAGDIDAHVIHKDTGARLKVKITKPSKGKYRFAFQPKKPGLYALHILVKKKEIKESPIYFRYEGPPRPDACIVRDVPEACYIREPTSFTVDATEAGSSNLVVKVASPSKGKEGELKILNNEDGTYTVDHTPEVLGEHKLNITWAGKTIPDSPVCINVKKRVPKAKTCLGPYVNIVPVGESVELDIINLGKYSGSDSYVTATARGKTGNDKPTVNDKDGTCKVTFMPTVTDDYIFNVKIHEEDVEGSPFYIKSVDKPSLSKDFEHPEGGCHSDVEVGKEVCLVIPRDELLPPGSEPQVEAIGPEGPCTVELIDEVESSYGLNFTPTIPGDYLVHVKKDKETEDEIDRSPFKVTATEKQSDALKVRVPESQQNIFADPIPLGTPVDFDINTADAGYGTLKVRQTGPGKADIKLTDKGRGVFGCNVLPTEKGQCTLDILWDDDGILGCPFNLMFVPIDEEEEEKEKDDRGMDLTDLLEEYIPKPIDEKMDATPADEVEAGIPLAPIKIERRQNPIIIVVGKALKLKVRPKDEVQREGTLVAKAQGEETGAGDVKTSQNEDGVFQVYFNPPKPDYYVVDVKLNGEDVPQSPFHVLYIPAPVQEPAVHAPVNEQLFATFIPDKPIDYNIDLSQAGDGALSAKCVGESCGDVPVTYAPVSPDSKKYKVAFVPPQPDLYNLSVFFDDKELKDSPYKIDLRKKIEEPVDMLRLDDTVEALPLLEAAEPTEEDGSNTSLAEVEEDAHTIEEVPPEEFTIYIGTPLVVKVHPKTDDQKNSELTGTAIGDSFGPVKVSTFRQPDDTMIVKVNPTQPDRYTVDIKLNDEAIPRSPFRVNYIMPPTDPTQCKLIGVEDIPDYIEVGTEVDLQVDTKKAGPGDLMVSATPTVEEENPSLLSAKKNDNETGMYDVTYIPNSQGKHSLNFKWADQSIPLSPVDILAIDPAKIEMVPYGKPAGVDVDSDSSLRAHYIHKESNQNYKVKTHKLQKGKYRLSFQPKDPGLYFLHAFVKDKELPQSPYIIRYARPAKPDACKVIGLGDRCFLGETVAFTVDTKEAGDGNLQIKTLGPDGKEKGTCDLKDNKDDTHSAEFAPEVAGMHELQITWAGKPVPGQPFPLFVRDHSKEELLAWLFLVDRLGELHPVDFPHKDQPEITANTDQALLLRVQARTDEQKNGKLTVKATDLDSDKKYDVEVTKTRGDTFEARFLPTVPQTYNIEALLDTKPIPNTPFAVKYNISQPDASKCVILGLEKHPDKFQVGKDIFFQVDTRLAGDGKLSLTADGVQVKPRLEAKASKEDTRIIDVTYTPAAPGTHMLKVLWSGEPVPKSPLSFPVEAITRYPYGKPVGLDIDLDARAGDIDAHVIHKDTGARLKVKITKPSKGKYRFAFQPKKPGLYALHILVKKKEIKESPIYFRYEGPPRPEACVVRDMPEACYIREPTSFTVDATEAGSSNLVVKVASPSKGKEGELKILNNEDGTYTVDHTPEVLGEHKFNITWAGKTIPDSPVCINVKKRVPKAKTCLGPHMNIVPVGESVELDIINLGKYSGSDSYVTATARGKTGNDKPTVNDKDGTCKVTFMPTVADDYIFNVKIHEEDVEGSPFYIKSVDKPSLSKDFEHPEGGCHSDVEVGKEVCLVIPRDELLPPGSEPQVEAIGPEGPCTVELIDEVESSYGLNFTPTIPGDYIVHVKKDKETEDEIDRSPFKVTATEKQSDALKVRVPESQQNLFVDPIPLGTPVGFDINTADAGYGTLKVRQTGPGKADIKLTDKGQGVFGCNVLPTERGRCTLEILWDDDGILGCPFTLTFVPIAGVQLEGEKFVVGTQNKFMVDRNNVVEGQLEVTCSETQAAEITILPSDDQKAYNCTITAKREGDYRITVKYNGYHIVGSPFNVHFLKPDNTHMSFSLQAEGAETSDVNATVQNSTTLEQLPVQLSDLFGGKYALDFTPTQGLEYLVTIKCLVKIKSEEKMMIGSPFVLNYERIPADASKCRAEGSGLAAAIAGEWSSFYVYTKGAGTGELKLDIAGDVFGDEEATITAITPTKYEVKYKLRKQGYYQIAVSWDGQNIPGSPFAINCTSPKADTNFGTPKFPSEVTFGEPVAFSLTPIQPLTEKQDIQVTARSSTRGTTPGSVTPSDDGSYKCSVEIKYPGKYLVEVSCNGAPIQGTPFSVKVTQPPKPEKVRAAGPGLQDGYIGQEGNFTIETEEAGSGKLSVNVEGPKGGFKINLNRHPEQERTILACYNPQNSGVYVVSIKWAGEEVPGSPFTVNIESEEEKGLEGN